jgi:hypothetical protein
MTDTELDAIRMRLEAITIKIEPYLSEFGNKVLIEGLIDESDVDFLINAPQDIQALLNEIDSLNKQNAEIQRVSEENHCLRTQALERALEIFGKKTCPTCVFKEECEENIFGEDDEKRKPCMKAANWQFDQARFLKEDS